MTIAEPLIDHLIKSSLGESYPTFVDASGIELVTSSGQRVLDACSGVGVTCLGYDAPAVVSRMAEQASRLPWVHGMRFETPVQQELAAKVASITPAGLDRCFFVSGGSEAVESAMKFARQYWVERGEPDRWRFVGRRPSFHGSTLATLSLGWHRARMVRQKPLLLDFPHISSPNLYRGCDFCGRGSGGCTAGCAEQLEQVMVREGPETIAAFIAEPVVGSAGGALVPPSGYFQHIREICDRYGILFISDEVITSFGRTGRWFGIEHEGVIPDIVVFAKGIGAGYAPLGGMAVREDLLTSFRQGSGFFEHNFTMAGHAVACAAGCAVIDEFQQRDLVSYVRESEAVLFSALADLRHNRLVGDVRGRGFLVGVELVADRETRRPFPRQQHIAEKVAAHAFEESLLVYPCGGADGDGDYLLLMPAFVTPVDVFSEFTRRLLRALERTEAEDLRG